MEYTSIPKAEKIRKNSTITSRLDREFTQIYQSFNTPSISLDCEYYLKSKSAYIGRLLKGEARDGAGKLIWRWDDRIAAFKKEMASMEREITSKYSSEISSYSANKVNQYLANIGKALDVTFTENASLRRKYDKTNSLHVMDKENHDIRNRLYSVMGAVNSVPVNRDKKDLENKVKQEKEDAKIAAHELSRDTLLKVIEDENTGRFVRIKATFLATPPSKEDRIYLKTLARNIQTGERKYWGDAYLNALAGGAPLATVSEEFAKDIPLYVKIEDFTQTDSRVNIAPKEPIVNEIPIYENKPKKSFFKKSVAYALSSLAALSIAGLAVNHFIKDDKRADKIEQKIIDSKTTKDLFAGYHK